MMQQDNTQLSILPRLIGAVLLLALAYFAILMLQTADSPASLDIFWEPRPHADQRHGADAETARQVVQEKGEYCRWDCPDGRTRYVCPADKHQFAVVVLEGLTEITAFITGDQAYVQNIIAPCKNPWRLSHP